MQVFSKKLSKTSINSLLNSQLPPAGNPRWVAVPQSAAVQVFSKKLSKTDVGVRLSFPMKGLKDFEFPVGKDKMEFEVTDGSEKAWTFGLSRRNVARHFHPKPVLSSGWRAYVQARGLRENDRVILYKQKDKLATKTRFKVRAQRKVLVPFKLFGQEIKVEEKWIDI